MPPATPDTIESFLARVRETARRHQMWHPGQRLLVAVSGGPDSVSLLDVLVRLAAEGALALVVAHFHHGLRGEEADADALYVQALASRYGLEAVVGRGDVRAEAERMGRGVEAAARRLRHGFLREQAREHSCERIALGHTASDRVETVLLHLLRGSGLWGLRGIPPVRPPFVRPLVEVWRADTEAYCRAAGLTWRVDRTNLEAGASLRNKIRHELLPLLEAEYRPRAAEAVLRCAEAVDAEMAWTEALVREALGGAVETAAGLARVRLASIRALPDGLLIRVLRHAASEAHGPLWDWSQVHFRALIHAAREGQTGHKVTLPGGLEGRVAYGWLEIGAPKEPAPEIPERPLPVPGRVDVPEAGISIGARIIAAEEAPGAGPTRAVVAESLAVGLLVRGWRPGDRFFPLGAPGSRKLQDFFVDAKVARDERGRKALVIHPQAGIIWVAGMRVGEKARPPEGVRRVLLLEATPYRTGCGDVGGL